MRFSELSLPSLLVLTFAFLTTPLSANEIIKVKPMHKSPEPGFYQRVPDEIIVKFKSGVTDEEIDEVNTNFGTKIKRKNFKHGKFKVLKIKKSKSLDEVLAKY